ncbi:hypothetical protein CL632_03875 [bacterium]|jgi:protein-disulfide isomerase|nr:hypothetical protein [bacterium]MDP6571831.1 thioredoxin domain-containing protein [Patescibacteria group bacterium]MDP6756344.1 thioredoxin domain-containing protein [Patescibacteria group bacterium]|tara:strand:- start:1356 stop:2000 length:645 start_codon:yes stop_codon:yes gene_type:complete
MQKNKIIIGVFSVIGIILILFLGYDVISKQASKAPEFDFTGIARPITYKESPSRGADSAKLAIYEYADFTCLGCFSMQQTIKQLISKYDSQVQHVWKDFPFLSNSSKQAAIAARCAYDQGKFWEYHDWLFANQADIALINFSDGAIGLGLDNERFTRCLEDDKIANLVDRDFAEAQALGIDETPTLVIGDVALVGVQEFSNIENLIISELQKAE